MNMVLRGRESHTRCLFIQVTPQLRRALEELIELAIDALDQIDGNPDAEDGGDHEPTLGWCEPLPNMLRVGGTDDLECEADEEDGNDDEPSLGWVEVEPNVIVTGLAEDLECVCEDEGAQCDDEGDDGADYEPWLGWHNETGQKGGTPLASLGLEG